MVLELKAELKSQWADLLSWMSIAFMQEKEKDGGAQGQKTAASAIRRAPGCSRWLF